MLRQLCLGQLTFEDKKNMKFLEKLQADREIDVQFWRKHPELRKQLVDDAYPDKAHFIYELLQNAEDARASCVFFELYADRLEFRHNGRIIFTESDIDAITDVSKSGKPDTGETIGKFGIGFKSVFKYTDTPQVYSGSYSFKITDFVYPEVIPEIHGLGMDTLFIFPFNSSKKASSVAHNEIALGLNQLSETTLLFLSNLHTIQWRIEKDMDGEIQRIEHSINHIEVRKNSGKSTSSSLHFLRFSEPVVNKPKLNLSVAFALDFLLNITKFDKITSLSKQLKIKPANPGQVSIFFPAEKETSGLRFHLHAPFVPELSRASVKETDANKPLFEQLAKLTASSLHVIRDLGLLSGEFLGVLPNLNDSIPARYQPIRSAIIDAMNNEPLAPTFSHSHAPAKNLLQAKASLKSLLSEEDIALLVVSAQKPVQWAIGATQKNSDQDRFLGGLNIINWDIKEFLELLDEKAQDDLWQQPDELFMRWMGNKSVEWHQQMYALLYRELSSSDDLYRLKPLHIVRLNNGNYSIGSKCFFPANGALDDGLFPRVDRNVYSSGTSKQQQEHARKFLEEAGVREVGEVDEVESILQQRYTAKAFNPDIRDIERFVSLVEGNPAHAKIFSGFLIFKRVDNMWSTASHVFLDSPYCETLLSAYYDALGKDGKKKMLSEAYLQGKTSSERVRKFAELVGVQTRLFVEKKAIWEHPLRSDLCKDILRRNTHTGINEDWGIPKFEELLKNRSEKLSQLIWHTLCHAGSHILKARYSPNRQYEVIEKPSSLVLLLKRLPWVPQQNGGFVHPSAASRALLPRGFPFDEGYEWLRAVGFGEEEWSKSEEYRRKRSAAAELGFENEEALGYGQWFAGLDPEARERVKEIFERERQTELPENAPSNPNQRALRVGAQAAKAPERRSETRLRAISVNREAAKEEARQYLRHQYTNSGGEMICQICKAALPFKLDDDSYYVEHVEFLSVKNNSNGLKKHYYQNYLALCPNHSAMFQYANGAPELMKEMFAELEEDELEVRLAKENSTIYFTKTHIADLKKVIQVDANVDEDVGDDQEEDESVPLRGIA